MVLVNDPDFEAEKANFGGKAMTYYGRWTYKYEEAARRGAAGVLIVHETDPASYGWATVKNSNTNTMFDIVRQNPASEHTVFESWIQRDTGRAAVPGSGLDFEPGQRPRQASRFPADDAQGDAVGQCEGEDRGNHVVQRRRHPAGQDAPRRDGDLHGPLGPSGHRTSPTRTATASTMARSTTRPASPT